MFTTDSAYVYKSAKEDIMKQKDNNLDDSGSLAFSYLCTNLAHLGTNNDFHYQGKNNADNIKMHFLMHCEAYCINKKFECIIYLFA